MSTSHPPQPAVRALYAGLALTIAATVVPYVDRATGDVLAHHLWAAYPVYTQERIDAAATTWLAYLTVVGALGAACWLSAIHGVRRGRRFARGVATLFFSLGSGIALVNLLVRDTSGDTGLPPLLGWVGLVPSAAGLVAVMLLWRSPTRAVRD